MLEAAQIIDGKKISAEIKEELKKKISGFLTVSDQNKLDERFSRPPCLAVILVGDDPASHYYVSSKEKSCEAVGIKSIKKIMAASISKEELLQQIAEFNKDDGIDGILLQLPLPEHLREFTQDIVDSISVDKDVDGLTTANLGRLLSNSKSAIHPCTPKGCMELLKRYGIKTEAKRVLVIGRSTLVGLPISILLNQANATVIMAHSRTANLEEECKNADIIVAAIGKPNYIQGSWLKAGAVVIDVGINAVMQVQADGSELKKIVGDVDFKTASEKASFITPVPGGVGLMTVAMLLSNTVELYLRKIVYNLN